MIHAVLIFNTHGKQYILVQANNAGKPRLSKFYTPVPPLTQQALISQIFSLISDRPAGVCNFLDAPELVFPSSSSSEKSNNGNGVTRPSNGTASTDDDTRVIYRHYATLYFV